MALNFLITISWTLFQMYPIDSNMMFPSFIFEILQFVFLLSFHTQELLNISLISKWKVP